MENEKQIEEMAWDLCDIPMHPSIKSCEQCGSKGCHAKYYAKRAIDKDYRKVVMCKDCKYFFNEHIKACTYWNGHATTETNYCSCAKTKGTE